jgi:VIT1/CCC1 family predicted Fe2+/Mn2+ transporter
MAASNFLGTRAEHEDLLRLEEVEHRHIDLEPEGEREEVRQIFQQKGFTGADLERIVELVTANRERWVRTMLSEEYGLPRSVRSAWIAAFSTFTAFVICGLVPLLPYLFSFESSLKTSVVMTAVVFFVIGAVKSRWSTASWVRSGISTLLVGGVAAALAYVAGLVLKDLTL